MRTMTRIYVMLGLAKYLQKPHGIWAKYIPEPLRAV